MKCCLFKKKDSFCSAVIVAAGNSVRMGQNKTLIELDNIPIIVRTIKCFDECEHVDEIIVVTKSDLIETVSSLVNKYKLTKVSKVITGGKTRCESSLCGVSEVNPKAEFIAIHDGARPFASVQLIENCIKEAKQYFSVVPVVRCVDTLRYVTDGFISEEIDRDKVVRVQTPQVFKADMIKGALTFAVTKNIDVTDDSSAMTLLGFKTKAVIGDEENIKITTPADLLIAEAILKKHGEVL